jgi:DNA polymerase-3 subunit delta'
MPLKDVIGQERAMRMLAGAIERGRVASSYLFAGEQGIGKRFAAMKFAKAVCCRSPVEGDACGRCPSCRKLDSGTHPDFLLIEPDGGMIKVEHIRRLEEVLSLKSYEGGAKAVVVDDAEAMNISAANAFLKTLEEPAPESLIILVSSAPDRLPDTIRSRCMRINFRPLSPKDCLRIIGKKSGDRDQLVRLSMGRPGLAVRENLLKKRDRFMASVRKMLAEHGKHPWKDRQDMERWLDMALLLLRDMAVLKATGRPGGLVNGDLADELEGMGRGASLRGIIDGYEKLRKVRATLGFNLNRGITWNYIGSIMEAL